jgi:hypothetical protein
MQIDALVNGNSLRASLLHDINQICITDRKDAHEANS